MMELSTRPPPNAPSCYASQSEYQRYERSYGMPGSGAPRQPLEESNGNAQLRHTPTLPSTGPPYNGSQHQHQQQHLDAYSSIQSSIPTPPIIPSQAFSSVYGQQGVPSGARVPDRRRSHHVSSQYYPRAPTTLLMMTRNPMVRAPQFANYRKKQDEDKANGSACARSDKKQQVWPDVLEAACLDALLLIPLTMGKKKVGKKEDGEFKQYGRNELIERYLWFAYLESLPPGVAPDPELWLVMDRRETDPKKKGKGRKKVSSHIQVLKGFFKGIPCYHFFFTSKGKVIKSSASDAGKSLASNKDLDATDNLGLHPVIYSLVNENRLPAERPNYEYFAQLLADEQLVSVRPRRCWIFVAHADYVVTAHEAPLDEDGNPGEATFTATNPTTGDELAHPEDYPYLKENAFKDSWPREERAMVPGTLLHQLTKNLEQVESSCVREVSSQWESDFPELAARLHNAVEESGGELQEPGVPNPNRCEFLHMHMTLELQRRRHFPAQSELNSWVEINVEQPHLLNHRWKVETRLVRPAELLRGDNDTPLTHVETEMGVLYVHRPGCEAGATNSSRGCDCLSQRCRRQVVSVPFPADTAARMLTYCAEYPAHPLSPRNDRSDDAAAQANSKSRTRGKKNKNVTQMDLLPQIAMCQEIYSCPPEMHTDETDPDNKTDGATKTPWKRRAVLLWTFETIHSIQKHQGEDKLVTAPSGRGTWRFLTPLDPTSRQHQQRSMVLPTHGNVHGQLTPRNSLSVPSGPHGGRQLSRDSVLSPTPSYQHHLSAGMNENFQTVWENPNNRPNGMFAFNGNQPMAQGFHPNGQPLYQSLASPSGPGGLSILASHHHGGLATPPPTASMNGSFHQSFDAGSQVQEADMRHPSMSFMSVTSSGETDSSYLAGNAAAHHHNNGYPTGSVYDEVPQDFQGWVTAANAAGSIPAAVDNRLHPGYWGAPQQQQAQYNPASRHVSQSSVLDWAVPSPHDSPITGQPLKTEGAAAAAMHAALSQQQQQQQQQTEQWRGKDPTPISADTSPRPLTDSSSRESQERQQQGQGSWVNVPVGVATGRTPSTDLSQDWEAINQSHESVVEPAAMKLQTVGEGQALMSAEGYFPQHQQGVVSVQQQEMAPNGHEAQYERFRGHKRRRMFVEDYSMGQQRMKMARTDE
ncbi:hypothetical protein CONLIGDRAFT_647826 [Coniochaeta ligniaria NRRL 30616]|uniref:TEA domain-containing protein n=1 Tax=Coniochaeta ligniaria NRRL 30616 TaxID=1408157 RepID=A0A1J7IF81_9PEZI|nr:hypothetical protein CONLIGDRAFT_647826 [Coniochaeta ligniaria NRRL 30616]